MMLIDASALSQSRIVVQRLSVKTSNVIA